MTLPTDIDLAQACVDCYVQTTVWDQSWSREDVHVGLRHAGDFDIIAFRGSVDEEDWLRDFEGWPKNHSVLGYCHSGFLEGMDIVAGDELSQAIIASGKPYVLTGHSLGAARALIVAGLLTELKIPPSLVVTFGTPRPGMEKLSGILNGGGYPIRHYKNGPDPVADVPVAIGPLHYQKPQPDIELNAPPVLDAHEPFHWHHMPLYLEGVKKLSA